MIDTKLNIPELVELLKIEYRNPKIDVLENDDHIKLVVQRKDISGKPHTLNFFLDKDCVCFNFDFSDDYQKAKQDIAYSDILSLNLYFAAD